MSGALVYTMSATLSNDNKADEAEDKMARNHANFWKQTADRLAAAPAIYPLRQ